MSEETDLWRRVLAGDETVDFLDLAGLIPTNASESFLWDQFRTLPSASSLIDRILELQRDNSVGTYITPDPANRQPRPVIEGLAKDWQRSVLAYLRSSGEEALALDVDNNRINWVYDNTEFLRMAQDGNMPISEVGDYLGDEYRPYLRAKKPWGYALDEAALRLTTYPVITRWLLEEVVGFPMKSRSYYDLWRAGGDVIFMKGYMVILCEAGPD